MSNAKRVLFAQNIVDSLNLVVAGEWKLGTGMKETSSFVSIELLYTNGPTSLTFSLMVGKIHACDGDSADILFDHGDWVEDIATITRQSYNEYLLAESLHYFFDSKGIEVDTLESKVRASFDAVAEKGFLPVNYDRDFYEFWEWLIDHNIEAKQYASLSEGGKQELVRDWASPVFA